MRKELIFLIGFTFIQTMKTFPPSITAFTAGLIYTAIITDCAAHSAQHYMDRKYLLISYHPGNNDQKRTAYNANLARKKNLCIKYGVIAPTFLIGISISFIISLLCAGVI